MASKSWSSKLSLSIQVVSTRSSGRTTLPESENVYDACITGKQSRISFKSKQVISTSRPLELIHMDLYGPMLVRSFSGSRYVIVIIVDYSRFTWTIFLNSKSDAYY